MITPVLPEKLRFLTTPQRLWRRAYTWESCAVAEAFYAGPWCQSIHDSFGSEPEIRWFESPVVVDNEQGRITASPAL